MSTVAEKIRADAVQARKTAIGMAIRIVEGAKVKDSDVIATRQAADMDAGEFADLIDVLTQRKEADDACHARDWAGELAEAKRRRIKVSGDLEKSQAELEAMQSRVRDLHEDLRIANHKASSIANDQTAASRELTRVLKATGGGADWRDFH